MITFSIVTVVYNGQTVLEKTIQSVLAQTYPFIEYIIVDGGSKDDTLKIIHKYDARINKWISEPDRGIYDAMNKGIKMATGDFILFLNAGDRLYDPATLEKIAAQIKPDTDVAYGETMLVDDRNVELGTRSELTPQKLPKRLNWQSMRFGMVVCHQSFLMKNKPTPPMYMLDNLCSDIDWVIECLKRSKNVVDAQTIISAYLVGGVSKVRYRQSMKDRFEILSKHFGTLNNLFDHLLIAARLLGFKIKRANKRTY